MIRYPNGYIIETDPPENAFFVYGELNAARIYRQGLPAGCTESLQRRLAAEE